MGKKLEVVLRKKIDSDNWDFLFAELISPQSLKRETILYIDIRRYYDEWDKQILQPEICKQFGCGKQLSPTEKLYGGRCVNHQKKETNLIAIDKHLSL